MGRITNIRGQIIGQVFIYIMVGLVIGVIILIGYKAITGITAKSCQVEQLGFQTDIEAFIAKYNSYGSVTKKTMTAPCNYETICFVSVDADTAPGKFKCGNVIIQSSYDPKAKQNIYVVSKKATLPIGYAPLLTTADANNCTCIPQRNGNFYLTFIGQGSRTNVTAS